MPEAKSKSSTAGPSIWIAVFTGNSGLTHYSFCLARALHAGAGDVSLITNRNFDMDFLRPDFPVVKLFRRSRYYFPDLFRFWRLFKKQRPAIVHYQSFLKFPAVEIILLKLQKRLGTGLVITAHDWLPHHRLPHHRLLFKMYYRMCDEIIVHTESGRRFLAGELGVPRDRISVIPHGSYDVFMTDRELTAERARQRLKLDPDRFWFLFFGRIDTHKGLDVAIRALAHTAAPSGAAASAEPGLIVAGDPERDDLKDYTGLIDELGLRERVRLFIGHIPVRDVQIYFQAADAVVLPYRESSTSGVYHLAMGFRKPVVAAGVGGLVDTIVDGDTGILVPPGDERRLAAAMARVAGDEAVRLRLAEGWRRVQRDHAWERIAGLTREVYRRARA